MASVEPATVVRVIGLLKVLVVPEVRIEAVPVMAVVAGIDVGVTPPYAHVKDVPACMELTVTTP